MGSRTRTRKTTPSTAPPRLWRTLSHKGPFFPVSQGPGTEVMCSGKSVRVPHEAAVAIQRMSEAVLRQKLTVAQRKTLQARFWDSWRSTYAPTCTPLAAKDVKAMVAVADAVVRDPPPQRRVKNSKVPGPVLGEQGFDTACVDGRSEAIANYRMEAPGMFTGRGDHHPSAGKVKRSVRSSDVTINLGPGAKVQRPSDGGTWKQVVHDSHASWLASWKDPATGKTKYMRLADNSTEDLAKFETARRVARALPGVRRSSTTELGHLVAKGVMGPELQTVCCFLLIDRFALRIGGDRKGRVFGATTLCFRHMRLRPSGSVSLDFLGKDSVACQCDGTVSSELYRGLTFLQKRKGVSEDSRVFDMIDDRDVNAYVAAKFPSKRTLEVHTCDDVTAKTIRTAMACMMYEGVLLGLKVAKWTKEEQWRLRMFERVAAAHVALLCNHRRTSAKAGTGSSMGTSSGGSQTEMSKALTTFLRDFMCVTCTQAEARAAFGHLTAGLNLSTGPANYVDPRITRAFEARHGLDAGACSAPLLRKKFTWADNTKALFRFMA